MWLLEYSPEANQYALDSYPYDEDVLSAIELLALRLDALPSSDYRELEPEYYLWSVAQHTVLFRRIVLLSKIRILAIRPDE